MGGRGTGVTPQAYGTALPDLRSRCRCDVGPTGGQEQVRPRQVLAGTYREGVVVGLHAGRSEALSQGHRLRCAHHGRRTAAPGRCRLASAVVQACPTTCEANGPLRTRRLPDVDAATAQGCVIAAHVEQMLVGPCGAVSSAGALRRAVVVADQRAVAMDLVGLAGRAANSARTTDTCSTPPTCVRQLTGCGRYRGQRVPPDSPR